MFTREEYKHALTTIHSQMSERDFDMLQAQYDAPERTVSAPQLATSIGLSHYQPINRFYGSLGRRLAPYLGPPPHRFARDNSPAWFSYLSTWRLGEQGYLWIMWPTLALALEELGFVNKADFVLPEEVSITATYYEGAVRHLTVNAYERNPAARRRCIAHYGPSCYACGFDFAATYGEVGAGYIHVHHLRQLADIDAQYEVNPITDLRPLCPNCHAIIHRRTPPYTIEEVQAMLEAARRHNGDD